MASFFIADDSREKIIMLRHFLKVAGWTGEVLTAMTCAEAYDVIAKHADIAYAFVDYYIPADNGPSIIRRLKAAYPSCRIALASSAESERNAAEARAAGAEEVLCTSHRSDLVESRFRELLADWLQDQ